MSAPGSWPGERVEVEPAAVADDAENAVEPVVEAAAEPEPAVEAAEPEPAAAVDEAEAAEADPAVDPAEPYEDDADTGDEEPHLRIAGEAAELRVPDDVDVLEGEARGFRRGVGIVAARANVGATNLLLESALAELDRAGVGRESITVMAVPGAFELPLGAMALAKTRRYACIVALGCVVRDGAGNDLVAGEAASGLQLAALETGVPVSFGVLAVDEPGEAEEHAERGAEAVRTALEMADLFAQLRAAAQAAQ